MFPERSTAIGRATSSRFPGPLYRATHASRTVAAYGLNVVGTGCEEMKFSSEVVGPPLKRDSAAIAEKTSATKALNRNNANTRNNPPIHTDNTATLHILDACEPIAFLPVESSRRQANWKPKRFRNLRICFATLKWC